jgi:ribosome modulation factor
MSANPLTEAYVQGFRFGIDGGDPRLCPFEKMTAECKAWNEGQARGAVFYRYLHGSENVQLRTRNPRLRP